MSQIGATGKKTKIHIDTMGVPHTMTTYSLKGLVLSDLDSQHFIELGEVYTKDTIPATYAHIPQQSDIEKWPHLAGVTLPQIHSGVDLLIGNNIADACTPLEIRTGPRGSPYASRSLLGWAIWNLVRESDVKTLSINRIQLHAVEQLAGDRRLEQIYQKSLSIDFPERQIDDKKEDSVEDKQFRLKVDKSIQFIDGHYQLGFPFRDDVKLPNNKIQGFPA